LFVDDVARRAFLAIGAAAGDVEAALEAADPEAREFIERASVADVDADPVVESRNLIAAATRRRLARAGHVEHPDELRALREARLQLELLNDPASADEASEALLGWLDGGALERE